MAGNTRGKLKENFEGMHRNFDWCLHHVNHSLALIATQLAFTDAMLAVKGDKDKEEQVLMDNPLYKGIRALGEGVKQIDELAQGIYAHI